MKNYFSGEGIVSVGEGSTGVEVAVGSTSMVGVGVSIISAVTTGVISSVDASQDLGASLDLRKYKVAAEMMINPMY